MKFRRALPVVALALAEVFAPPKPLVPSVWAAENLVVADGPRAGNAWDPSLAPYVQDIIDALGPDSPHNFGAVRKGSQVGLTVASLALLGSYIDRAPCRMSYAGPTIDFLQEFNREKLMPAIEQTPALAKKVKGQLSRSASGSTSTSKRFPGGSLVLINANSAPDLRSKTLKVGIADEVDEWAEDLDGQGDPLGLYEARFTAFHATGDHRILALSTPTLAGFSRIDKLFEKGDQRYWKMICPGCSERISFEFKHLKFNRKPPYKAEYVPPCCGVPIEHHQKPAVVRSGRFEATNAEGLYPSWHVDALISLVETWDDIAAKWWSAQGSEPELKKFWNHSLGRAFESRGDAPEYERLMERREDYAENVIPPLGFLFVGAADVQHTGIWFEGVAYAPDRQSWCITRRWLEGDTTDPERGAFALLTQVYEEYFDDSYGGQRQIDALGVDAGDGQRMNQVLTWCRGRARAYATKGRDGWSAPAIAGTPSKVDINLRGKRKRRGATLWPIGTWSLKSTWYADLRKEGKRAGQECDPPGYCHFGEWLDEEYFKQITGEYLATKRIKGRTRKVWEELPGRENHLLDCRIIAMAMADHLGLNRMTPAQWARLAARRGAPERLQNPDLFDADSIKIAASDDPSTDQPKDKKPKKSKTLSELARKLNG